MLIFHCIHICHKKHDTTIGDQDDNSFQQIGRVTEISVSYLERVDLFFAATTFGDGKKFKHGGRKDIFSSS